MLVRNLALTPAAFGQAVTFMVNVTVLVRVPTGTVQFTLNGVNFGAPVSGCSGTGSCVMMMTSLQKATATFDLSERKVYLPFIRR